MFSISARMTLLDLPPPPMTLDCVTIASPCFASSMSAWNIFCFEALLEALVERGQAVGQRNSIALTDYMGKY